MCKAGLLLLPVYNIQIYSFCVLMPLWKAFQLIDYLVRNYKSEIQNSTINNKHQVLGQKQEQLKAMKSKWYKAKDKKFSENNI